MDVYVWGIFGSVVEMQEIADQQQEEEEEGTKTTNIDDIDPIATSPNAEERDLLLIPRWTNIFIIVWLQELTLA